MTKKTHMMVGAAATIPIFLISKNPYLLIGLIGSTIPDIDLRIGIKHRTITHGFIALISSTLAISLFNIYVALIWGLNYSIHLILDSFTKTGVPLFYPYNKKYYGMKLICTGQSEDLFICLIAMFIIASYLKLF